MTTSTSTPIPKAEAVHDGVAEHVHRVGEQRRGACQNPRDELDQEHPHVDPEDDLEHATLALGNVVPDLAAVLHRATLPEREASPVMTLA
jgi:hypothetical protein